MERIGTLGIFTIINKAIMQIFKVDEYMNMVMRIEPLVIKELVKKYIKTINYQAKKIILHKVKKEELKISRISAQNISDEEIGSTDIVYNAPKNKHIAVAKWFESFKDKKGLYSVEAGQNFADIDFVITVGGKEKTLSINNVNSLGTNMDISREIEKKLVSGYPPYRVVDNEAMTIVSYLNEQFKIRK